MDIVIFEREDTIFEYIKSLYDGLEIHFRRNKATNEVDMMLSDNIAKIHGFGTLREMFEGRLGYPISDAIYNQMLSTFGWLRVERDGIYPIIPQQFNGRAMGDA